MATVPGGDQFGLDVVVIGGCGHVGLPLAIAFADRGARVGIYDVSEAAVASGERRPAAVRRAGRGRGARARGRGRAAPGLDRPVDRGHGRARGGGDRHAGRRAPEPRPDRDPEGAGRLRAVPARRPAAGPAVHGLPRRHRAGGEDDRGPRRGDRGGVLPGADRRGQGDDRAVRAAADRLRAVAAGPGARREAVRPADRAASSSCRRRRPSWPSCSPTCGATSSSRRPTSST